MNKGFPCVYFNGRFLTKPIIGVQRYASELLQALDKVLENEETISQKYKFVCLIPPETNPDTLPDWKNIHIQKCGHLHGNLWEQIELPFFARKGLLVDLCNIGPIFHFNQIVVFHDASVFAVPNAYSKTFQLKYRIIFWILARTARKILTDSQFSMNELAHYLKINKNKIITIPAGCEHILNAPPDFSILKDERLTQSLFLLAVGSSSPHKNVVNLVKAIGKVSDQSVNLVIAGGNFSKVFKTVRESESSRIIHLGYVTDAELRALYSRAIGFVFPSLYEGFGFPPLEAMTCGCPVICSNRASLPEICGDAALYFDPLDVEEISHQINQLIGNSSLQNSLRQRGFERVKQYTWKKAANQFWEILQKQ
jgi:glycosyltransferase involved in cell wall biosynthesis